MKSLCIPLLVGLRIIAFLDQLVVMIALNRQGPQFEPGWWHLQKFEVVPSLPSEKDDAQTKKYDALQLMEMPFSLWRASRKNPRQRRVEVRRA